jgi:hypothetical protein
MANVNLIDSSNIKVTQSNNNISLDFGSETVVDSIRTKNMFDKGNITTGLTYTNTGTTIGLAETFVQYTYISVKPNTKYTIGTTTDYTSDTNYRLQILEYNSSKTFIKRNQGLSRTYTITTTANTYFVRLGASTITKDQLQFEESNTQTTYAPYQNLTGQEIYSTGETVIGTWINGKPLYRKVFTANSLANNGVLIINHNIQNLEKVTKISYSWYDTQDSKWYEGIRWDSATAYIKADGVRSTSVLISCIGTNWSTRTQDVSVVLEYTKTTD